MRTQDPRTPLLALALAGAVALSAGCGGGDEGGGGEVPPMSDTTGAMAPSTQQIVPDTTAIALWAHLEGQDYASEWARWPDTEPYHEGTEPHGVLLTTYLNPEAEVGLEALMGRLREVDAEMAPGAHALPHGSIVVKENFAPDSSLVAVTVMYKVPGYNPEQRDWFWLKRLPDGTVEAAGRVQSCIDCHQENVDVDYLMTLR